MVLTFRIFHPNFLFVPKKAKSCVIRLLSQIIESKDHGNQICCWKNWSVETRTFCNYKKHIVENLILQSPYIHTKIQPLILWIILFFSCYSFWLQKTMVTVKISVIFFLINIIDPFQVSLFHCDCYHIKWKWKRKYERYFLMLFLQ